jgi:hypothetical protein
MFNGGRIVTDESLKEVGVWETAVLLDCRFRPEINVVKLFFFVVIDAALK